MRNVVGMKAQDSMYRKVILIKDVASSRDFDDAIQAKVLSESVSVIDVFPCEGALIWDSYGSMVRSVLSRIYSAESATDIWVLGYAKQVLNIISHPGQNLPQSTLDTVQYLMKYVYHIQPQDWFSGNMDVRTNVRSTIDLLNNHPFIPENTGITGYVFNPVLNRLDDIEHSEEDKVLDSIVKGVEDEFRF